MILLLTEVNISIDTLNYRKDSIVMHLGIALWAKGISTGEVPGSGLAIVGII